MKDMDSVSSRMAEKSNGAQTLDIFSKAVDKNH